MVANLRPSIISVILLCQKSFGIPFRNSSKCFSGHEFADERRLAHFGERHSDTSNAYHIKCNF